MRALLAALAIIGSLVTPSFAGVPNFTQSAVKVCKEVKCKGHGTGVYIGKGYYLTANHVAIHNTQNQVYITDQNNRNAFANIVWLSPFHDIALLHTRTKVTTLPATLACRAPDIWENTITTGYPNDFGLMSTKGYVTSLQEKIAYWTAAYIYDALATNGSSGGPVYNTEGALLGLHVGSSKEKNYAIFEPIHKVCNIIKSVMTDG